MNLRSLIPSLPLLRRELAELASRRQTYIVRVIGAVVLLSVVFVTLHETLQSAIADHRLQSAGPGSAFPGAAPGAGRNWFLGIGGTVFSGIVPKLFYCVQLLMPALCCGTITMEKERNTLGTLFLTRLSPLTIVLEKLCSRLVPMLTFLLLTFPVLAFVYSLGGVDTHLLLSTLGLLLCECLLYASIGILCSSWFRTTVSAFMCSYFVVAILLVFTAAGGPSMTPFGVWQQTFGRNPQGVEMNELLAGTVAGSSAPTIAAIRATVTISRTIPAMFVSVVCVGLATVFLTQRAFVTGTSPLLRVFRVVDQFFVRLNDGTTGGIVIVRDQDLLPAFDPISWRERSRKSLGKARYLFRIVTVMEVPTLSVCSLVATAGGGVGAEPLQYLLAISWLLAGLIIIVKASTAISSERARETLEALLSTPMTGARILQEKIIGMRRLMIVLAVPILTTHLTLMMMELDTPGARILYLALASSATGLTMQLLAWISIAAGLRAKSQMKSVLTAAAVILIWATVVPVFEFLTATFGLPYLLQTTMWQVLKSVLSPHGLIVLNEEFLAAGGGRWGSALQMGAVNSTEYAGRIALVAIIAAVIGALLLALVRSQVLRQAPRLLRRLDQAPDPSVPEADMILRQEAAV